MSPSTPTTIALPVSTIVESTLHLVGGNNNNNHFGESDQLNHHHSVNHRLQGKPLCGGANEEEERNEEDHDPEDNEDNGDDEMLIHSNEVKGASSLSSSPTTPATTTTPTAAVLTTVTCSTSTNHRNQHGIYKPRRHARSKSPVLKRVSFGSSKGSMVETLIYDHSEEDLLLKSNGNNERHLNGNRINLYSQPVHFHYPVNRRLGSRVASDSTISGSLFLDRPSRVRVSLVESVGRPGSIVISPETPEPSSAFTVSSLSPSPFNNNNKNSTLSRIVYPPSSASNHHHLQSYYNHQSPNNLTLQSTTVVDNHSPNHSQNPHHHHHQQHQSDLLTLDLVKMMDRKVSVDSGIENPFRPGGELSREAETIVNLIKEGKPISPTTPTKDLSSADKILNGISSSSPTSLSSPGTPSNQSPLNGELSPNRSIGLSNGRNSNISHYLENNSKSRLSPQQQSNDPSKVYLQSNGSSKLLLLNGNGEKPTIVEIERSTISPTDPPPEPDLVNLKVKGKKCICCVVQ